MIEKRAAPRMIAKRMVYLAIGSQAVKCRLIDIAEGGARISVAESLQLQDGLILIDGRSGLAHRTRLAWRSSHEAGLQFVQSVPFDGPVGGLPGAPGVAAAAARRLASIPA